MTRPYLRHPPAEALATAVGLRIVSPLAGGRFLVRCPDDHEFSVRSCAIRQAHARGHRVRCRECEEAKAEARGVCSRCAGLSWRRDGIKCSGCGGRFAHEAQRPVVEFLVQQPVREL